MLQFLTAGTYDPENGLYCTPTGQPCYYYASDNLWSPAYKGLTPEDLVDPDPVNYRRFYSSCSVDAWRDTEQVSRPR
jgi:hypothetical protein